MKAVGLAVAVLAFASCALAQDEHFAIHVSAAGVFSRTATSNDGTVTLKPTRSLSIGGGIRYRFSRRHSLELNIGRTHNSQLFIVAPDTFRITTTVAEYTVAYLLSPFERKRWEPFVFGGAGALRFQPGTTYIDGFQASIGAASETALGFLYGAGAVYHVLGPIGLRFEYRGLIYKEPHFKVPRLFTGARGHMAEPAVGIVLRF